ncbi:MAG: glycosyltransferase family 39 protein [Elusimicrobia bacterium]|nr:glycosyltransferase family 39 protein [Elusimicrobiota bacterium]
MPRWFWLILALTATAPFWDLGHPLLEVDDARYAEVPREMALGGDWATPHLNELDYVEKPPLWYWVCAASYKIFGVSEAAARLPLALLALLALLGTAWLGSWLYGPRQGWTAAALLGSSMLFFALTHFITPDLGLTVWLLWCTALLLRCLLRPEDSAWAAPAAWACAGLAFLSKGLVGLVFPLAWAAALWLLCAEWRPRLRALLRPGGPALFLLLVAPWFVLMERRHPGFLRFFFYEHHVLRFATQKFDRYNPWYFFLLVLPAGLLPWTPAVAAGLGRTLGDWRRGDKRAAALAAWAVLVTAFFSGSRSKLLTYILPVFPHLAVLGAAAVVEKPLWAKRLGAAIGALLLIAAAAAVPVCRLVPAGELPFPGAPALAAAALTVLGAALLCWSREVQPLLTGCAAGLLVGGLGLVGMRAAAESLSARGLAAAISSRRGPADLVYVYGTYPHGLPFYTGRRVDRMIQWHGELEYADRDERIRKERFGGPEFISALPLADRRVFTVCLRRDAAIVLSLVPAGKVRLAQAFGRWALVEF